MSTHSQLIFRFYGPSTENILTKSAERKNPDRNKLRKIFLKAFNVQDGLRKSKVSKTTIILKIINFHHVQLTCYSIQTFHNLGREMKYLRFFLCE